MYIDDIIICHRDPKVLEVHTRTTLDLLKSLGFQVNWEKCSLTPSTVIMHLGFVIDSTNLSVSLPTGKL